MQKEYLSEDLIKYWEEEKVLIFQDLIDKVTCSSTTLRAHLKKIKAITSFNNNSKYYTIPSIANFDSNGLWFYNGISFSQHGSLIDTIIYFIDASTKGMSAKEIFNLLQVDLYSFLNKLENKSKLSRKKIRGIYVYFSADKNIKRNQIIERQFSTTKITDEIGIIILTIFIKNPEIHIEELQDKLSQQAIHLNLESLNEFFEIHQLKKKV
jgi:hypothetical protein